MTMPIALSTRKRRRRARLLAALTTPLMALGLIAGGLTASGGTASAASFCHLLNGWGGTYYCGTDGWYQMPNGYSEVFVIGTDKAVWTRWNSSNGLSGWVSLGGKCINTGSPIGTGVVPDHDAWSWWISCTGTDGNAWYNTRLGSDDGSATWTGWRTEIALSL